MVCPRCKREADDWLFRKLRIPKVMRHWTYQLYLEGQLRGFVWGRTYCGWCLAHYSRLNEKNYDAIYGKARYRLLHPIHKKLTNSEYRRRYAQKHPDRVKCRKHYKYAKQTGKLRPEPCRICQATDQIHGHHPDYSKPLNVIWLCREHHREIHADKDFRESISRSMTSR